MARVPFLLHVGVCRACATDSMALSCPRCPNRLEDYVGGASNFEGSNITAHDFWRQRGEQDEQNDKCTCVASNILRQNADLLDKMPLALQLLPDPQEPSQMTKRVWERALRARAMMGLLNQRAEDFAPSFQVSACRGEHLSRNSANPLDGLPRPKRFEGYEEEWRCMALENGVQLHMALVSQQQRTCFSWTTNSAYSANMRKT